MRLSIDGTVVEVGSQPDGRSYISIKTRALKSGVGIRQRVEFSVDKTHAAQVAKYLYREIRATWLSGDLIMLALLCERCHGVGECSEDPFKGEPRVTCPECHGCGHESEAT